MHRQTPSHSRFPNIRPTPVLMLGVWLGFSHLTLTALSAQASDIIIPAEPAAPAPVRPPAPVKPAAARPAPKPVVRSAPKPVVRPAPKPVVRSAPTPKPISPKPVVKAAPKPVNSVIEPVPTAPKAAPIAPKAPVVKTAPASSPPVISPAARPVAKPITVPTAPRAKSPSPALIDGSRNYDLGATKPYVKPNQVIVTERRSGCRSVISQKSLSNSLCGSPPPARTVRVQPTRRIAPLPRQRVATLRQPYVTAGTVRPVPQNLSFAPRPQSAPISKGLSPATAPTFAAKPYQQGQTVQTKPFTGANPLKWLLKDNKRMLFPLAIPAQITSAFGWRVHPISGQQKFHTGTDIGAPMGTPVVAAFDGQVAIADYLGGYGLSVLLHHNAGEQATRYAHLSEIFVQPGQTVDQGSVIGLVGSTGYSTGPHLHFEAMRKTPQGYVFMDPDTELKVALTVLVEATRLAQLPEQPPQPLGGGELSVVAQPSTPDVLTSYGYQLTE